MDTVYEYLGLAAYYGILAGLAICYVWLLGYMLWYKQWLNFFLSIFFAFCLGAGALIPLVIGWQEAKNWKIPKLIRIYSVLVVFGFFIVSHRIWVDLTTHKEPVDSKSAKFKAKFKGKGVPPAIKKGTPGANPR
jgi:hypothetical protein